MDLPTTNELVEAGRAAFRTSIDPNGTGAVNLAAGSRNDTAISLLAGIFSRVNRYVADRVAAARIASSTGDDLAAAALDLYGEQKKAAAASVGFVRLTRTGTGVTSIPNATRVGVPAAGTQPRVMFQASQDVAVASGVTFAVVPLICTQTGPLGNVQNLGGQSPIASILDALPDTTWVVDRSTLYTFGGGANQETDDEFKARLALTTPQTERQRGTKAAIDTGALRVPGNAFETAIEPLDGTVILYAGDSAFQLPDALKQAIDTEQLNWRCFGVPTLVRPYNAQMVQVTAVVHMARSLANYNQAAIVSAATQKVIEYFRARPRPDEYYREMISGAIGKAHPEIQHIVLSAPLVDQSRPADSGYGTVTALNRYKADESSIAITIQPPTTA